MTSTNPAIDPDLVVDVATRSGVVSRRDALNKTARYGAALAAAPLALAAISKKAYGQSLPDNIQNVLRFALTLEHLEYDFYVMGTNKSGLIPNSEAPLFETIRDHEGDHVRFLQTALGLTPGVGPGAAGRPPNGFDFTAGGALNTFDSYQTFLAVSQGFEDTGVRAYKGQAPALISNDAILTAALQIHSVEGRHASAVRRVRNIKGWITDDDNEVAAIQATYEGEDNVIQGGVDLQAALGSTYGSDAITEAFDEPLTMQQVLNIAGPFINP